MGYSADAFITKAVLFISLLAEASSLLSQSAGHHSPRILSQHQHTHTYERCILRELKGDSSKAQDSQKQPTAAAFINEIGVFSNVGSDPQRPQKVNQDAYFQASFQTPSDANNDSSMYTCVGVLDGHGLKGHIVSEYLAHQLPFLFQSYMENLLGMELHVHGVEPSGDFRAIKEKFPGIESEIKAFEEKIVTIAGISSKELSLDGKSLVHQAMVKSFHSAHVAAMQEESVPAGRNGATCVMIVLDHSTRTIHLGHVGDSRAIRVNVEKGSDNNQHQFQISQLSVETTVKIETEKERIELGEGTIRGSNVFYGPVGIAMTRSLGNAVMLRGGVVPTPVMESFSLASPSPESMQYLVLATDGIWDVLTNEAVAEILVENLQRGGNAQSACDSIAEAARKKWVGDLPIVDEEKVDDITVMVVAFV